MDYLEYKGYKGSVEYSKADNCLCGKVLGMSKDLILYEGNTIDELRADFEAGKAILPAVWLMAWNLVNLIAAR